MMHVRCDEVEQIEKHCSDDYPDADQPPSVASYLFRGGDDESENGCGKHNSSAEPHHGVIPLVRQFFYAKS